MKQKQLLRLSEVVELAGVSYHVIEKMTKAGSLKSTIPIAGGRRFYKTADVEAAFGIKIWKTTN